MRASLAVLLEGAVQLLVRLMYRPSFVVGAARLKHAQPCEPWRGLSMCGNGGDRIGLPAASLKGVGQAKYRFGPSERLFCPDNNGSDFVAISEQIMEKLNEACEAVATPWMPPEHFVWAVGGRPPNEHR